MYRVVKCEVIKKLILEFLNMNFILRKSFKNNVQMLKPIDYGMLSIGWDMTIWINRFPIGTHIILLWFVMLWTRPNITIFDALSENEIQIEKF